MKWGAQITMHAGGHMPAETGGDEDEEGAERDRDIKENIDVMRIQKNEKSAKI